MTQITITPVTVPADGTSVITVADLPVGSSVKIYHSDSISDSTLSAWFPEINDGELLISFDTVGFYVIVVTGSETIDGTFHSYDLEAHVDAI